MLRTPAGERRVQLAVPGVFNVYNAVEAAATLHVLGVDVDAIARGLGRVGPVFGRSEMVRIGAAEATLLLAKNPTGMDEITRMLGSLDTSLNLLLCLNDSVFDGRDVSWIWDADFESIVGQIDSVVCTGSRAAEMALRMKYAGVPEAAISIEDTWDGAIAASARHQRIFAIANYTAMLDLRDALVQGGHAERVWS
jgi:UDP-N-acetylmuramyl tripeptide synthase